MLTTGNANLLMQHGTARQKQVFALNEFSGRWAGTMCLTEPGAGSDVGALKTTAKRNADGTYSFVLCPEDPGVHNWLDTCGMREGMLTLRMDGMKKIERGVTTLEEVVKETAG